MMKRFYWALLVGALLLTGCSDKDEKEGEMSTLEKLSALKNMGKELEKIGEEGDKLKNTSPISQDEIKALIPETMGNLNLPRKSLKMGQVGMSDMSMASAEYYNDKQELYIQLSITDGAGEMGASMTSMLRMRLATNFYKEEENHYEKTTMTSTMKMVEEQTTDPNHPRRFQSRLMYLVADRFMVVVESNNRQAKILKDIVNRTGLLKKLELIARKNH